LSIARGAGIHRVSADQFSAANRVGIEITWAHPMIAREDGGDPDGCRRKKMLTASVLHR
jgi:hypothetical protein